MKRYLILCEDESLWRDFKKTCSKDINSEIIDLIKNRVKKGVKKGGLKE